MSIYKATYIPLFQTSGNVSSQFQSQSVEASWHFGRGVCEIYIYIYSPLVQQLCWCIWPSQQPAAFPTF